MNILQNFIPKKKLSQNFLIDKNILKKISSSASIQNDDIILEIGPGLGHLTTELLTYKFHKLIIIEKDKDLIEILQKKFTSPNILLIHDDFLKLDLSFLKKIISTKKIKIISNIPYNISTPILVKLLRNHKLFSQITLTIQEELANRICAKDVDKNKGSISIFTKLFSADQKILFNISNKSFFPIPKVTSSVIQLTCKDHIELPVDIVPLFETFMKSIFSKRRKKITSCLKGLYDKTAIKEACEASQINMNKRPEELSYDLFIKLFNFLHIN